MQRLAGHVVRCIQPTNDERVRRAHVWHWTQAQHDSAAHGTYRVAMALPPEQAAKRFAKSVQDVLDRARTRGLSDKDIRNLTGVGPSTFHRWRRGVWGEEGPKLDRVISFYEGLGEDPSIAMNALGVEWKNETGEPLALDPTSDPDVRAVLRKLADPNTSPQMRATIKQMLRYLASLTEAQLDEPEHAA